MSTTLQLVTYKVRFGVLSARSNVEGSLPCFLRVVVPGLVSRSNWFVRRSCNIGSAPVWLRRTAGPPQNGWCRLKSPTIRCWPGVWIAARTCGIGVFHVVVSYDTGVSLYML